MFTPNTQNVEPDITPVIVDAPVSPIASGPIYQVTLPTGAILTNPGAFPADVGGPREMNPYVAEDGQLLISSQEDCIGPVQHGVPFLQLPL